MQPIASMRPAQIAREIATAKLVADETSRSFNEARANCAGNSWGSVYVREIRPGFNEARANCAGNCRLAIAGSGAVPRFNEARANCAGNWHPDGCEAEPPLRLQ